MDDQMKSLTPGERSNWKDALNNLQDYESRLTVAQIGKTQTEKAIKTHLENTPGEREDASSWYAQKRSLEEMLAMHQENTQRYANQIVSTREIIQTYVQRAQERTKAKDKMLAQEAYQRESEKRIAQFVVDLLIEKGLLQ